MIQCLCLIFINIVINVSQWLAFDYFGHHLCKFFLITYGYPFGAVKIGFLESKIRKITSHIAKLRKITSHTAESVANNTCSEEFGY